MWIVAEDSFNPAALHHGETIFTIGNGYLSTRGALEEGYPGDSRAVFIHGVFDDAPVVATELANAPDWLPLDIRLNGHLFSLHTGVVEALHRSLDLRTGVLTRRVRWRSPAGQAATLVFERFASLADAHQLFLRCQVIPEFAGTLEFRAALNGYSDNRGRAHWEWLGQGQRGEAVYLHSQTRRSRIQLGLAMWFGAVSGLPVDSAFWDAHGVPTQTVTFQARPGEAVEVEKRVGVWTSRDTDRPVQAAVASAQAAAGWPAALAAQTESWAREWARCDVEIEGDDEAQVSVRFNLFQMLIAAPRGDDRVSIGAKTLSGFDYSGHAFWDTEIFMLPLFTFTAPHIARNLLNYRYRNLPGARAKARANGFEGAQFPWESAAEGVEVTPTWVPHFGDPTQLVRIWTGDIEIHISADIAYAAYQYWTATGDDDWLIAQGAELILETARFWAARAEWKAAANRFEFTEVIGPDEYHDHVDNNAYTNHLAQWNLQTAPAVLAWLKNCAPDRAAELSNRLDLSPQRLAAWRNVADKIYLPVEPDGLIPQFDGYFQRRPVDLAALEPRGVSAQALFGIEGCNATQVLKQPDVLMLQYLLPERFSARSLRVNYDYYTPRTDHTHGSSLGPAIQAIMACEVGRPDEAYEHFIRAARADLRDVRGNAGDGIHGASAAGTWQAIAFGFGGLRVTAAGWAATPRLPRHWRRLRFRFFHRGQLQVVELPAAADR